MGFFSKINKTGNNEKAGRSRRTRQAIEAGSNDESRELAGKEMMNRAERELYQFEAPQQDLGLSDLIAKHKAGQRFQFLALTGGETETFEARMRRMTTFRPRTNKTMIPLNELPHIKLINDSEDLNLASVLPKKGVGEYIRISGVCAYFSPTVSVMSKFSKVKVALMDSRFEPPGEIQSVTTNTNMDAKIELSMDYCIPRMSAAKLRLIVTREQAVMAFGEQWGALQAQVILEQTSFPYMSEMKRVIGILGPTASALEDHEVNPNTLDITMTENNRQAMRELYQQGDIADEGEAIIVKKKATQYAKSSIKTLPKGELAESSGVVRPGWEHLSNLRKPQIAAEEASVEPDSDDDSDYNPQTVLKAKEDWEKEQNRLRLQHEVMSDTTEEILRPATPPIAIRKSAIKPVHSRMDSLVQQPTLSRAPLEPLQKRGVQFTESGV